MSQRTLSFTGTHIEIGKQIGEQYYAWEKREVWVPQHAEEYIHTQLKTYESYFPQYLELLEGIAIALHIDKNKVFKSYLTGFLHIKNITQCSAFAVKSKSDVFVGRNYDWRESSEKGSALCTYAFSDSSSLNYRGMTDMGTWQMSTQVLPHQYVIMLNDAWNEKGLYIALNGSPERDNTIGMATSHAIQAIAEQCTTTEEAIDMLEKIPLNQSKIFTIADKSGSLAVFEKSLKHGNHVRSSKEFIIATNHYNHEALLKLNLTIFEQVPFHATFGTYHYLLYSILSERSTLDVNRIVEILKKPPTLQNWRGRANGDTVTTWVSSVNLTTQHFKVVFSPLTEDFTEIIEN
ncbi:hypothetical protein COU88_02950 [Candidatus Roizmanbacteria bacterium CG10_big_fil_rev_8_21_14_0_10_39_6]|uniref:Peptidase C45 hydrolase domain-containing protein n=1 Tax=Candidatus Roizmanbacteria bacterium CG10_big_fil_rev_8_21_14_0_10_39_6 TaxID=1974853 RepID=A0A2M8KSC9_9BACT|nr:MAG: hypothetical protein COU88_02950 [Candidatus Roizmanbacteria bacterium CG10_big_fil_rev_8_21_14_0_10_39_6]